jgi:quercetin dioxygenase-like cupin family protein
VEIQPKPPTTKGSAETFTGDVWVDPIAQGGPPSRLRVGVVRFAPGAHTAWHRHANGQTLYILEGRGLVSLGAVTSCRSVRGTRLSPHPGSGTGMAPPRAIS